MSTNNNNNNNNKISFIGLGSNLDNPKAQILAAITAISNHNNITLLKQSSLYQTKPYGNTKQKDFINAVIKISTSLNCVDLLYFLNFIEKQQKRVRNGIWAEPRTIDLDILDYNSEVITTKNLIIPHYDIKNRMFVLQPWYEIEPEWVLPDGDSIEILIKINSKNNNICNRENNMILDVL